MISLLSAWLNWWCCSISGKLNSLPVSARSVADRLLLALLERIDIKLGRVDSLDAEVVALGAAVHLVVVI